MENLRNGINIQHVIYYDTKIVYKVKVYSADLLSKSFGTFDCFSFKNQTATVKRLRHFGFCVLDFSGLEMYKFYNLMLNPNLED